MNRPVPPRRLALGASALLALPLALAAAYLGPSAYVAVTLTRARRRPVTTDPRALGLAVTDVAFPSREDGLALRGWLLSAPPPPADGVRPLIVLVHGRDGVRDDPSIGLTPLAAALAHAGFDVLMFDLRGHGASAGEHYSFGWYERRDLLGALDWAQARGYTRLGVYGFSLGAATALLTAAEDARVTAVAVDSGYAALDEILALRLPREAHLPRWYVPGVILLARLLYGADARRIRPVAAAAALGDRPLLILQGTEDTWVPATDARRLWAARYGAGGDPAEAHLRLFPGAGHVKSYQTAPAAYLAAVLTFWREALPASKAERRAPPVVAVA